MKNYATRRFATFLIAALTMLSYAPAASADPSPVVKLEPFSHTDFWTFKKYLGDGKISLRQDPDGDFMEFESVGEKGMAATLGSIPFRVEAGREYVVKMEIRTENLNPIDGRMVGGVYFLYRDMADNPASFYPSQGLIAPANTTWKEMTQIIRTPTTAGTAQLFLVYSGYGNWTGGHPRVTGRASGRLCIRNVRVSAGDKTPVLPATIHVSDPVIQAGIETAAACLHNASLNGRFEVSDGYTISGNIVPDLSFGLFGARRVGHPEYMEMFQKYWGRLATQISDEGRLTSQRVMGQVFFPLGVDEIFSFTGDKAFLSELLPLADRSLDYLAGKGDDNGLVRLVDYGKWRIGEGADWVDWYPSRMEGKTLMFHQWYVQALKRMAALHEEFAGGIGSLEKARKYRERAVLVEHSLRRLYWRGDHFITNIDYQGKPAEEKWCDDQVWAIKWGVATPEQTAKIWEWMDADPVRYEGVPMSWAAFDGPQHGRLSWFGRQGAGDILARYQSGQEERALQLLQRISSIFARDRNIYEAYDMSGNLASGTSGWGNYTEHIGGYFWSVIEGPFGIDFTRDSEASAAIRPRFPASWTSADAAVYIRGAKVKVSYSSGNAGRVLSLMGEGEPRSIRIVPPNGKARVVKVGMGSPQVLLSLPEGETKVTKAPPIAAQSGPKTLDRITLAIDRKVLNPVREKGATGRLTLTAFYSDGSKRTLRPSEAVITARTKSASGNVDVVTIEGDKIVPKEGGIATVEAAVSQAGRRLKAATDVVVAPFYRDYHQTLVLKLFLGMEGEPVERLAKEPMFQKKHDVICTFEEALEVIRKTDNLTRGIPKIVYLVGWQKGGHDHGYPAWDEVNPRLKRKQDANALQSLRWLIREAREFNTTVSLHINMVDAYKQSPLWDEYVAKDCIARDASGQLRVGGIQMKGEDMYNVVYPREWQEGLAQRRIDGLIKMIPELHEGHTIHIDVFVAQGEGGKPLSPWHAKPGNGGLTPEKYVETQRKIFKYWRERGFDVTGEGIFWAHPPGEGFTGLQPMSWWYPADLNYQMEIPEYLMARGRTHRDGEGDFRFSSSMHGEEIYQEDKENLPGFMGMFCRTTLPWYYLSRLERMRFENGALFYSDGVVARTEEGRNIIRKGEFVLRENDDLFVPALWKKKEIIAYSKTGCEDKPWRLPAEWSNVRNVALYRITVDGCVLLRPRVAVTDSKLVLSLGKDEAVSIVPAGTKLSGRR